MFEVIFVSANKIFTKFSKKYHLPVADGSKKNDVKIENSCSFTYGAFMDTRSPPSPLQLSEADCQARDATSA